MSARRKMEAYAVIYSKIHSAALKHPATKV